MNKLLSIIFAIIICMPGYADDTRCETNVSAKYGPMYSFNNDSEYQTLLQSMQNAEKDKLKKWKVETVTNRDYKGECSHSFGQTVSWQCNIGQKHKDCVAEPCWELTAEITSNTLLEFNAKEAFKKQKIREQCYKQNQSSGADSSNNATQTNSSAQATTEESINTNSTRPIGTQPVSNDSAESTDVEKAVNAVSSATTATATNPPTADVSSPWTQGIPSPVTNMNNADVEPTPTESNTPSTSSGPQVIQTVTITVKDKETNETLPGANIQIVDTGTGAATDANGNATLTNVPTDSKIRFGFVGYTTQILSVSETMTVQLQPENTVLDAAEISACAKKAAAKTIACQQCTDDEQCSVENCSGTCVITECWGQGECVDLVDGKCVVKTIANGKWSLDNSEAPGCFLRCDTDKGFVANDDFNACQQKDRDCDKTKDSKIWPEHATAAAYKNNKCHATECENGYSPEKGACVSDDDSDCDKKDRPENSRKSHRYYDASENKTLCLVDKCKKGYKRSNDLLSCIPESALSEEDAKKRMDELKDNAQKMRDREQSMENKLLGAAGIATVGAGGMMIASAMAEQKADEEAETNMKAYLATFRCDYGQGRNILGSETGVSLPGASELIQYTTEYKQLALNLKSDKAALGIRPGIESETVFDAATTGLYNDVSIGAQRGAFTSLSRALLDENSADAAEWQAMKDKTAKSLKTGATLAAAGAVGTLAGNLAINHGKGDQSGNIWNKFEKQKKPVTDVSPARKPCPKGSSGKYIPNCECPGNAYFSSNDGCVTCANGQTVNADKNGCESQSEKPVTCSTGYENKNQIGKCEKCNLTGAVDPNDACKCIDSIAERLNNECKCKDGYTPTDNNSCAITPPILSTAISVDTSANSDSTFGPGECTIEDQACQTIIQKIQTSLNAAFTDPASTYNNWKQNAAKSTVTVKISGYTDRQGFKPNQTGKCLNRDVRNEDKDKLNKELSTKRAKAMYACIEGHKSDLFGNAGTIQYQPQVSDDMGKGQEACTECDTENQTKTVCEKCRRVDVSIAISR